MRPERRQGHASFVLVVSCWSMLAMLTASEPALHLQVASGAATVGDTVHLELDLRLPPGWSIDDEDAVIRAFAGERLTRVDGPRRERSAEGESRQWTIELTATRSGAWALPRPQVVVVGPSAERRELQAAEVLLDIDAGPEALSLPPARGLDGLARAADIATATPPSRWWWIVLGAVLLLAAIVVAIARRRRPPADPAVLAQSAIDGLDPQRWRLAADGLSLALRRYAGAIARFDGSACTARECWSRLGQREPQADDRELRRLLDTLDALRWAPEGPGAASIKPLLDAGRAWVGADQARRQAAAEAAA